MDIVQQLREKIDSSALVIILVTRNWGFDLKALAELGMCIALDKPILALKHEDAELSHALRELAVDWEEWDGTEGSCQQATERLLKRNQSLFEADRQYQAERFHPKPDKPSVN